MNTKTMARTIAGLAVVFGVSACGIPGLGSIPGAPSAAKSPGAAPVPAAVSTATGSDRFCTSMVDFLGGGLEGIDKLLGSKNPQVDAQQLADSYEAMLRQRTDAAIAAAPPELKADVATWLQDGLPGTPQTDRDVSAASDRVAQYVADHCLGEALAGLSKLGDGSLPNLQGLADELQKAGGTNDLDKLTGITGLDDLVDSAKAGH